MVGIRKAERADHAAVVDLWHCPSFKAMLPKAVQDGSPPERGYLASAASAMTKAGGLFVVLEGDEVVGTLNRFGDLANPEIGWFVGEGHRGRGVATRAVEAFADLLVAEGAESIRFGMFGSNAASVRVAEKLGLGPLPARAGTPAGHLRYEVTRDEWEARLPFTPAVP